MTIKINFCDFWPGFEANNLFLKFLWKHFSVIISEKPDYLFYSVYGNRHLEYKNCIKILYTGENLVPDFNLCDYAMGYHYLDFGDRYMRFPLYIYYQWYYSDLTKGRSILTEESFKLYGGLEKRKFCNFIYSNNANSDPVRDAFFHRLNQFRYVDSGGRHLNNIGHQVHDKMEFIKHYKFTIAFENSSVPGYTTEKLLEPILANSLPVYYGNPLVHLDFNADSFIQVNGLKDFDRAINEIILLDKNDDLYLEKLRRPKLKNDNIPGIWEEKLLNFLNTIFNQPPNTAKRKPDHGFNRFYTDELKLQADLLRKARERNYNKTKIKVFINRFLSHFSKH